MDNDSSQRSLPQGWPVLVTGAGGFVGGHVARALAASGYRVRALTRRPPRPDPTSLALDWVIGDVRRERDLQRAVEGVRGVVHAAGWVSLGRDSRDESWAINVDATESLLACCVRTGVERFVYTSTLWTVAAGSADEPADEDAEWNLMSIRSPYSETKREAERRVLARSGNSLLTAVICPGLVIGSGDVRPTSTGLLLKMCRFPVAIVPSGGIPVVDARVVALAHVRALERAESGRRYVVAGPYLSYPELAALVARVAGRPRRVLVIPDSWEPPMARLAEIIGRLGRRRLTDVSGAAVAGGFLRLHASGARADAAFGLRHPPPEHSIFEALDDFRRSGRAPWLGSLHAATISGSSDSLVEPTPHPTLPHKWGGFPTPPSPSGRGPG